MYYSPGGRAETRTWVCLVPFGLDPWKLEHGIREREGGRKEKKPFGEVVGWLPLELLEPTPARDCLGSMPLGIVLQRMGDWACLLRAGLGYTDSPIHSHPALL